MLKLSFTKTNLSLIWASVALVGVLVFISSCSSVDSSTFTSLDSVIGEDLNWPRKAKSSAGEIEINSPPQRILTLSAGHDEIVYALLGGDTKRMVGVSSATHDYSNIGAKVSGLVGVSKDVEEVIQVAPDIVVVDKFTTQETINLYKEVGLKVFQTSAEDIDFNTENILTLGYILGLEEEARSLVQKIVAFTKQLETLESTTPIEAVVMSGSEYGIWVNGHGTTPDGIIRAAKLSNSASEVSSSNGFVELESLVKFAPEVIFITFGGEEFKNTLHSTPYLGDVPAIKNNKVYVVSESYFSTLSHWNICGVVEVIELLHPDRVEEFDICEHLKST